MEKNKLYDIIYMDPPWWYQGQSQVTTGNKITSNVEKHYPSMRDTELKALPVYDMLNKDALVFMWVGSPILQRAMDIALHWGLQYATIGFCWDKVRVNPGFYTMSQVELCLIFKKGRIPKPRGKRNVLQFLSEKRREHSRKPDSIRDRINEMFPTQSKLEMFARTTTDGWDVWGNEIDKY